MNLRHDLDELARAELTWYGPSKALEGDALGVHLALFDLRQRVVRAQRYAVHWSRELRASSTGVELAALLEEVTKRMEAGAELAPYLSKAARKLGSRDHLLMHWGIHHLHLSPISTIDSTGHVARSDELLFFRVEGASIYLIDIRPHHELSVFERDQLVDIVESNWPDLHMSLNRVGPARKLTPADVRGLRKRNVNTLVRAGERTVMPAFGVTSSGHSLSGVMEADRRSRELREIERLVRENYEAWFPKSSAWVTSIQLVGVDDRDYQIRDGATGFVLELAPS